MTDRYFGMKFLRAVREDPDVFKALEGWAFASHHIKKLERRIDTLVSNQVRDRKDFETRINTLQNRMTNFQEDISKFNNRLSALETERDHQ